MKSSSNTIKEILVRGARENNLKNIDIDIPHGKITVITGLSGSGKSTLAFDTIYAEGQRRYVESLSAYARNFLDQLKKPEVDSVSGLTPSLSIDQKTNSSSPRSTVGTITELYDYLRLLFAKVGVAYCPTHNVPVQAQSAKDIFESIKKRKAGSKFYLLAPMAQDKKGEFLKEFKLWQKKGFTQAKVDGKYIELATAKKLAKTKQHNVDLLIDRLILKESLYPRIRESLASAISLSGGQVAIEWLDGSKKEDPSNTVVFSTKQACPKCGFNFPKIDHRFFSFNNPRGACEDCNGLGYVEYEWEDSDAEDDDDLAAESQEVCQTCHGTRLKEEPQMVFVHDSNITELSNLSAKNLSKKISQFKFSERQKVIADQILKQISERLEYLDRVGVSYLSISRPAKTLSGGETQRIRLASQIGSSLVGVTYVLDEPSIGLHPRDHNRLLKVITDLKDLGNTIVMVEHDEDTIKSADLLIDMGPLAGVNGGELIAKGSPKNLAKNKQSLTGLYLSGAKSIPIPKKRREFSSEKKISIIGASGNNLKNISVDFPLENLVVVTGVSGSGKSTLVIDTLYKYASNTINKNNHVVANYREIHGIENVDKIVDINQKPIGRTPRSNPATYIGLLPMIRNLFAQHPESRMRGYTPGRFSFNVKGGRCEPCQGAGVVKVEMHFMSNVYVKCDTCLGKRYNRETLNIKYREKNISDVLNMTVAEAKDFFENHKHIHNKLATLDKVGLNYITLGQSSITLSGGEAQRIKLSKELSKRATGKTLYILDEPTTGLHFEDISKLVQLMNELVDAKNTVVVIEHNLDVIKCADHIIDIGPNGGDDGGKVIATGTPEEISKNSKSATGQYLKRVLS